MAEKCDCVVIGAGVIGLAIARALAKSGREVIVLERHEGIAVETSSRNSEVIHAGIYYPTGSLKAATCVEGKRLLYEHCQEYRVPHENIGKVIVATSENQFDVLRTYQKQALINGVGELKWLDQSRVNELEPAVDALAGVFSPTTGIIDSHAFMLSLEGDLESHGGVIAFNTEVQELRFNTAKTLICADMTLEPEVLVNSAGLNAPALSAQVGGGYRSYYAKGHYYTLSGKSPFNHLVYPIAEEGGLGVHVTLDMAHQARFGPDVVWMNDVDYGFDEDKREDFIAAIKAYYPDLDESRLQPGYTGIRPKLGPQSQPASDFVINGPEETGHTGYVELLGIESPGLTSSLAIANRTLEMLGQTS